MRTHRRRRSQRRGDAGFTLMEVMVAGLVLVVGLIAISQFFGSAMARVMDSRTRSILHQVASEEIEKVRALKYADVGLVNSMPGGTLLATTETKVVAGHDRVYRPRDHIRAGRRRTRDRIRPTTGA